MYSYADANYGDSDVDEKYKISVQLGSANTGRVDAPTSGFPSEAGYEMYKIIGLNEGTDDIYTYEFDHFDCLDS